MKSFLSFFLKVCGDKKKKKKKKKWLLVQAGTLGLTSTRAAAVSPNFAFAQLVEMSTQR